MGISERKEREKLQRKSLIMEVAQKLFFAKGFRETTMDDIAREAELSKGTLYLYYSSKDEIFLEICSNGMRKILHRFEEAQKSKKYGIEKIAAIGFAYFDFMKEEADYFELMSKINSMDLDITKLQEKLEINESLNNQITLMMVEILKNGKSDGSIKLSLNENLMALVLQAESTGIFNMVHKMSMSHKISDNVTSEAILAYWMELTTERLKNPEFDIDKLKES